MDSNYTFRFRKILWPSQNIHTLLTISSSSLSSTLIRTSSSCDVLGFFKIGLKGLWLFLNKLLTFLFNFITFLVEWGEFVVGVKFCLTRLSSKLIVFASREFGKCSRISLWAALLLVKAFITSSGKGSSQRTKPHTITRRSWLKDFHQSKFTLVSL